MQTPKSRTFPQQFDLFLPREPRQESLLKLRWQPLSLHKTQSLWLCGRPDLLPVHSDDSVCQVLCNEQQTPSETISRHQVLGQPNDSAHSAVPGTPLPLRVLFEMCLLCASAHSCAYFREYHSSTSFTFVGCSLGVSTLSPMWQQRLRSAQAMQQSRKLWDVQCKGAHSAGKMQSVSMTAELKCAQNSV